MEAKPQFLGAIYSAFYDFIRDYNEVFREGVKIVSEIKGEDKMDKWARFWHDNKNEIKTGDVIIFAAGRRDVFANEEQRVIDGIADWGQEAKKIGVLFYYVGITHRHDLWVNSCLNKEIDRVNREEAKNFVRQKGEYIWLYFG